MATSWLTYVDIGLRYHDYNYSNPHPDDKHNDQDEHNSRNHNHGRAWSCTLGPMRWHWMDGCDHGTYSDLTVIL